MARKTGSHADITGPRVRAAAEKLIAKHGFAAVSMRQIAAEVGLQAGALYLYTPDKQSLLFDIMQEHLDELLAAWTNADPGGAPVPRLEAFCRFHIRYHLDRQDAVFIAYMELRNLAPENFATIETLRGKYEAALEGILRDGQKTGVFDIRDARLATMAVIAMLTGVNTWFREGGRLSRTKVEEIYWDLVRKAVVA
jgi:AcrR family transcriptional regulator